MGRSDKLTDPGPDSYGFQEHRDYLFAAWQALGISDNVTLVLHDWGTALGFHWAQQNASAVRGICHMEGIVRPVTWDEWPDAATAVFQGFRSSAGEDMVLKKNLFVERVLPGSILRELSETEMNIYRRPFATPGEDRRPTLSWPRQIPIDGEPEDVVDIVNEYSGWLQTASVPKLFINAEPGAILTGAQREFCRSWPNTTEITVPGIHFIQEDSPHDIGAAIAEWRASIS